MKSKISFFLLIIILAQYPMLYANGNPSVEIDDVAMVRNVIDGDTFDAFPVGRIRLADINAPEINQSGYNEAKELLNQLISNKRIYLDVDDIHVLDTTHTRIVCVVYVRYNSTHLENINEALFESGHAAKHDYQNEFTPSSWTLYVYEPVTELPETYIELKNDYLDLKTSCASL